MSEITDGELGRGVTIAIPVRNGGKTLRMVLDSFLRQTYPDIEIVISDNASTDETPDIGKEYSSRYPHIRYIRRDTSVTVLRNWELAYLEAKTPFFMWAPDDHLHSENFVQALVDSLDAAPEAGLAMGQVVKFRDYHSYKEQGRYYRFHCSTFGIPIWKRLMMDKNGPFAIYGLFRTSLLRNYKWYEHTISPDWPFFIYILTLTEITQSPYAIFYYQEGTAPIPHPEDRAKRAGYGDMEKYPTARLSWRCALASRDASRERGLQRHVLVDFVLVCTGLLWANRRHLLRWALKRY